MVVQQLDDAAIDRLFQAMADATRRDILERTIEREQSVSALANRYAMSFAAVQKHVAVLERAALVRKERRGREQLVSADRRTVRAASELLDRYEQLWRQRADRIADILAGVAEDSRTDGPGSPPAPTKGRER